MITRPLSGRMPEVATPPDPPIRLVATDLDGTLIGADLVIRPRVAAAIAEAQARGVLVVIATGRMYRSTLRFARALDLRAPLICYQGAYIREMPIGDEHCAAAHPARDDGRGRGPPGDPVVTGAGPGRARQPG